MKWQAICDRTGGAVAWGDSPNEERMRQSYPPGGRCLCGATFHFETVSSNMAQECPIAKTVRESRRKVRDSVRLVLETYQEEMRQLWRVWDGYDSDGFWMGKEPEPEYTLDIPKGPTSGDIRSILDLVRVL